ncbi:Cof-type HAD-IIB family hydrolase [Enterococcus sp. DIV1297f]|uniref:Cof-type HAD-IIB family hydrolase n=1 Tax=Enterococcus sp. DIV1297f TaxID=2774691 RepID=UPI003D2768B7
MIKLVAIDLDGTLLNPQGELSTSVKQTIQSVRQEKIKIVLCTGRPFYSLASLIKQLQLHKEDEYVISFNGAVLSDARGETVFFEQAVSYENFLQVLYLGQQLGLNYHIQSKEGIFTSSLVIDQYTAYDSILNRVPIKIVKLDELRHIPIYKVMLVGGKERINAAIPQIPPNWSKQFNHMRSLDCFYEFLPLQASKGQTLQRLTDQLGIQSNEVLAIGDNENDLSMLQFAGISVAMGNAAQTIKQQADYVTKSNEEDGVNHSLLQLLNEKRRIKS